MNTRKHYNPSARGWLVIGMALGLSLALWSILDSRETGYSLPNDAAARVNHRVIERADYARALQAVAADTREPLDATDRRQVLQRLINEQLLVQHALDLGLAQRSPQIRDLLVDNVFQGIRSQADTLEIDENRARAYYRENPALFRGPALLRLGFLRTGTQEAAGVAVRRLRAGNSWSRVHAELDTGAPPLPNALLPPDKLRDYLGPVLTRRAQALSAGEVSDPIPRTDGHYVLMLHDKQPPATPAFEQVADAVYQRLRRAHAETLLERKLAALRQQARIDIAGDLADDGQ